MLLPEADRFFCIVMGTAVLLMGSAVIAMGILMIREAFKRIS